MAITKRPPERSSALQRTFFTCFAALLAAVLYFGYWTLRSDAGTASLMPFACVFLAAAFAFDRLSAWLCRKGALSKRFPFIALSVAAVFFVSNAAFAFTYRYSPVWDAEAVFLGAQNWAAGDLTAAGSRTFDAQTYFLYFPNNLGAAAVLSFAFRVFGAFDAYTVAALFTAALLYCAVLSTALSAREIGGERIGLDALFLLCCTLPLFVCCAAFYTDFLSFAFPVSALYPLLRARRCATRAGKISLYALSAAVCAVGALIKITVLILPVAVCIWMLTERQWKRAALCAALFAAFAGAAFFALDAAVYPAQLNREQAKAMNTPAQHWVMMGLSPGGLYNGADYAFTRSFADPEERSTALNAEIAERLRGYGASGFLRHALRKLGYMYNDGTLMLSDYYDDSPEAPAWLQALLLPGGERYAIWKAVCGGAKLCMLLLALCGAIRLCFSARERSSGIPFLAIFGLMLFLSFWETSKRYSTNFYPLLILCAAQAFIPLRKSACL